MTYSLISFCTNLPDDLPQGEGVLTLFTALFEDEIVCEGDSESSHCSLTSFGGWSKDNNVSQLLSIIQTSEGKDSPSPPHPNS